MDNEQGCEPASKHGAKDGLNQIRADRACIGCGFNLFGQSVVREEHYDLAIVRCPECGVVGAIQSYPTMSHWVNRFRAILTALWILVLIGAFSISMMITMGFSAGATEIASTDLGELIGGLHAQWVEDQGQLALKAAEEAKASIDQMDDQAKAEDSTGQSTQDAGSEEASGAQEDEDEGAIDSLLAQGSSVVASSNVNPVISTVSNTNNGVTTVVSTFADGTTSTVVNGTSINNWGGYQWTPITPYWEENEMDAAIAQAGGVWSNLDRSFFVLFLPSGVIALMTGIFWSVTMLGARRSTAVWVPIIAGLGAGAISLAIQLTVSSNAWASEISNSLVAVYVIPIVIGFQIAVAVFGVFIGRKVARTVVLMTLPPGGRVSLSMLWTRDGLEMPRPKMR